MRTPASRSDLGKSLTAKNFLVCFAVGLAAFSGVSLPTDAMQPGEPTVIDTMDFTTIDDEAVLEIRAGGPLLYSHYRNPSNDWVVELANCVPGEELSDVDVQSGLIESVKISSERLGRGRPLTTLTVATRTASVASLVNQDDTLTVTFRPSDRGSVYASEPAELASASAPDQPALTEPGTQPVAEVATPAVVGGEETEPRALETGTVELVPVDSTRSEPGPALENPGPLDSTAPGEPAGTTTTRIPQQTAPRQARVALTGASSPVAGPPADGAAARSLRDVEIEGTGASASFHLEADGEPEWKSFFLADPPRFVLDIDGASNDVRRGTVDARTPWVERVRIGQFQTSPFPITRVVFDLREKRAPYLTRRGNVLVVSFGEPFTSDVTATPDITTTTTTTVPRGPTDPASVVRAYIDAFNRASVDDILLTVTQDIQWFSVIENRLLLEAEGTEDLSRSLRAYFASFTARSEIEDLIVNGRYVSMRERVRWNATDGTPHTQASLVVFEIEGDRISRTWYYPSQP